MRKTFVDGQPKAQLSGTVQRQPAGFAYSIQKDWTRLKGPQRINSKEISIGVLQRSLCSKLVTRPEICKLVKLILHNPAKDVYADYLFTNDVSGLKGAIVLNVGWYPHQFLNIPEIL